MLNEIMTFTGNALALELTDAFTEADTLKIKQLFDAKTDAGHQHINILIKVPDLGLLSRIDLKAFLKG